MNRLRILIAATAVTTLAGSDGMAASNNCKLGKVAEWPVRLERNKVLVDGAINGQKIRVLLDTGAQRSLILRPAAARLGLTLQEAKGMRIFGVGGETHVEAAHIDEFRIGDMVRRDWVVLAAGEHAFDADTAFVLGEDFLSHVDVEFDFAHHAVRLFVAKDCSGVPLAYWATEGIGDVEIDGSASSSDKIIVTVQVNGKPVEALLDSGASRSVLDRNEAARLGVTPQMQGVAQAGSGGGLGERAVVHWTGQFESFAIGNEAIKDTTISFADLWKDATTVETGSHVPKKLFGLPGMLLGVDFLRSHRVLVAHSQHRMYFTYAGGPVFASVDSLGTKQKGADAERPAPGRASGPGADAQK